MTKTKDNLGPKVSRDHEEPVGVETLEQAAVILKADLAAVERASRQVQPWRHVDGVTMFWSVDQLRRQLRRQGRAVNGGSRNRPRLSLEDAEAAAVLAESAPYSQVAAAAGCSSSAMVAAWTFYGIKAPANANQRRAA